MLKLLKKRNTKIDTTKTIDIIENRIYSELKSFGFCKYGRTLHRFVDGDISQVINFQCGQAYRNETHLMWVNIGIRVPECSLREFHSDEHQKKYYHEYECNIRSCLGTIRGRKESCYDLRTNIEKIINDILKQLRKYVLPVFDILNNRYAILRERTNNKWFDITNRHLIILEEAMIYGKLGEIDTATMLFNQYYKQCFDKKEQNTPHIEYLKRLAKHLDISLESKK